MNPRRILIVAAMVVLATFPACSSSRPDATFTATPGLLATATAPIPSKTLTPPTSTSMSTPTAAAVTSVPATAAPTPSTEQPVSVATGPNPPTQPALSDAWVRPGDGMVMVFVPGGAFTMGGSTDDARARDDEFPAHAVTLDGYWIDKTEVNNEQYAAFLNEHGNSGEGGRRMLVLGKGYCQIREDEGLYSVGNAADRPVVMATWYGAEAYCHWAGGRLPTEAEWEYAARGPEGRLYPWGDEPPDCELARYGDCSRAPTAVGSFPGGASWCGALDMAGNVWEWVADWFEPYPASARENPAGPETGRIPVQRGGGWHSPWWELRTSYRQHDTARTGYNG